MGEFNQYNSNSQRMHILLIAQVSISLLVCNVDQAPFMVDSLRLANVGYHHMPISNTIALLIRSTGSCYVTLV